MFVLRLTLLKSTCFQQWKPMLYSLKNMRMIA